MKLNLDVQKDTSPSCIILSNSSFFLKSSTFTRIGFDNCIGYINIDNEDQILSFSEPNSLKCVNPSDFIKSDENSNVIDVRTKNEFNNGTYKASQNIPLSTIGQEIDNISDNSYVFCAGGYRSVIACSILMKNGKKDLINVIEGYSGINKQIKSQ